MAARLTDKQQRFVDEYLVDLNATAAAKRAGYSAKRASELGYQLLQKTTVQTALQKAMQARSQRLCITQDFVLERLREIAERDASDAPDSPLKYASKLRALELLGRHLGLFEDRLRVSGSIDTGKLDSILAQLGEHPPS